VEKKLCRESSDAEKMAMVWWDGFFGAKMVVFCWGKMDGLDMNLSFVYTFLGMFTSILREMIRKMDDYFLLKTGGQRPKTCFRKHLHLKGGEALNCKTSFNSLFNFSRWWQLNILYVHPKN